MKEQPSPQWKKHEPGSRSETLQKEMKKLGRYKIIAGYKPEYISEGSESVVLEVADHPGIVVKLFMRECGEVMRFNHHHGLAPESVASEIKQMMIEKEREERGRMEMLKKYFPHAPLAERRYVMQVPMTNDLAKMMFGEKVPTFSEKKTFTIPARVRFQERLPQEAQGKNALDIRLSYIESTVTSNEEYERLFAITEGSHRGERAYFEAYELGRKMLEFLEKHPDARPAIREFVSNAIAYSEQTGEALDTAGRNNIILYRDAEERWKIIMPDGMYPEKQLWKQARAVAEKYLPGADLSPHDAFLLAHGMNYARTINALADISGTPQRLSLSRGKIPGKGREFRHAILDARIVSSR